jgi:lipopolysaccharide export LptBFGC system permease protein LptF
MGCHGVSVKPSWKIRRRYIFAAFSLGAFMLISGSFATLLNNDSGTADLITGGVALVTLVLTSYIFGAVWQDKTKENADG